MDQANLRTDGVKLVVRSPMNSTQLPLHIHTGLAILIWLAIATADVLGVTLYWDLNGATPGSGVNLVGKGEWDPTGVIKKWNAVADGSGPSVAWSSGGDAVFSAGSDGADSHRADLTGNVSLASLTVEEGDVTMTSLTGSGLKLDFGSAIAAPINIAANTSFTQSNLTILAGTGGLAKTGAGTLFLRGTNTFTKSGTGNQPFLTITGGVVDFTSDLNLGAAPTATDNSAALTIDGGTLRYSGTSSGTLSPNRGVTIGANGGTFDVPMGIELALPSTSSNRALAGTGTVTKTGFGRFTLNTSTVNYSGKYVVNAGSIGFVHDGVFGKIPLTGQSDFFTLNGGSLNYTGPFTSIRISGPRGITLGANGGTLITGSSVMYNGVVSGSEGGKLTIALHDSVSDSNFSGFVQLDGTDSSYDGPTQIEAGMSLSVERLANGGANSSIGRSSSAASNLILNGGGLSYSATTASANTDRNLTVTELGGRISTSSSGTLTFTSTDAIAMTGSGSRTLTLSTPTPGTNRFGVISLSIGDPASGSTSLTKLGTGVWTLTNPNNDYTGTTTVSAGTLRLGAAAVIPDASAIATTSASAVFDLNGFSESVKTISGNLGSIALGTKQLSILNPSNETYSGVIAGTGGRLVKAGAGILTLAGANTYTGDTVIEAGTLNITTAYLANSADVWISSGAVLGLNFSGSDTIDSLFINGVSQVMGTWGGLSSLATHKSALFTGNGMLLVTKQLSGQAGDFNNNGVVDAADYAIWRKNINGNNALDNDSGLGTPIGQNHYNLWRANFGQSAGSGSGVNTANVPEPCLAAFIPLMLLAASRLRSRR